MATTLPKDDAQPSAPPPANVVVRLDRSARSKLARHPHGPGDLIRAILALARNFPRLPRKLEAPRGNLRSTSRVPVPQDTYENLQKVCWNYRVEMTELVTHLVLSAVRAERKPLTPISSKDWKRRPRISLEDWTLPTPISFKEARPWRRLPSEWPPTQNHSAEEASAKLRREFKKATDRIPPTSAKREVAQRVGQQFFREGLLDFWDGRCAVTGLDVPELLRASHARPWSESSDAQRLDVCNGLLLAVHLDAAFDKGLIAVADDGRVLVSPTLSKPQRRLLGLRKPLRVQRPERLTRAHRGYLAWHRAHHFNKG